MRVLSLSHRLQNRAVDNHTILNAPNIADYQAIVFDAAATFEVVRAAARGEGEFRTLADVAVANGDSVDGTAGLAAVLNRRREEIVRALENGAAICVFTAPQSRFHGVNGLNGLDRYLFLPAPDGMSWDEATIRGSEGTAVGIVDHGHPFVGVYESYEKDVLYRAVFNERANGFAKYGRVFLRSAGGDPVGVEFPVLNGRLIFLPTPKQAGRDRAVGAEASAIVEAMNAVLGLRDGDEPRWIGEFTPPGLADAQAAEKAAKEAADRARKAYEDAQSSTAAARALRDVMWASGDAVLLPGVQRCAEALGFSANKTVEGEPTLSDGTTVVHLVVAGSNEAVDMAPHYRLRQRQDAIIEARAVAPRGLVVVNGQRGTHPSERKREYVDALRVASEAVGYALITTAQLYRAAVAALSGAPDEQKAEMRRRLISTNGVVSFDDLLGSA